MNRILTTVLLAGAQLTLALYARAATYDVAADFSTNSNPNGVWSYGYATNLGGNLILYTDTSPSTTNVIWWRHNIALSVPAVFYNRSTNATTTANGTPHLAPHQAVFHPGPQNQYSIFRFTAPTAGTYLLQAAFVGADINGTTTDVHVLLNGSQLFVGSVIGFGPGTGPSFSSNLVLQAGDRIDFGVGYGGNGFGRDSTGIQATLTSAPQLSIQVVSAGQNRLSWSTNCTGFSLEAAANLPPTLWSPVTNSATIQGQQFTVTVDTTLPGAFYRLSNTP